MDRLTHTPLNERNVTTVSHVTNENVCGTGCVTVKSNPGIPVHSKRKRTNCT